MKLEPASLAQVRTGRDGRRVCIDEDVFDVARRLAQIDPSLSLHWNERGEYFVVVETGEDGRERLVTTTTELDGRLIEHVERLAHPPTTSWAKWIVWTRRRGVTRTIVSTSRPGR